MSRGGARPGAGRPKGNTRKITVSLLNELIAKKPEGMTFSEWFMAGMKAYTK